mgnify:CR=1 FL=1
MKKVSILQTLSILTAFLLPSCGSETSSIYHLGSSSTAPSSKEDSSSFETPSSNTSSSEQTIESSNNSSKSQAISSTHVNSSSVSSQVVSSSSQISSSVTISSSQTSSSSNQVSSSSIVSSSQVCSSSSEQSSSSVISSNSSSAISNSVISSSSSSVSSSSSALSSSSSSSSISSSSEPIIDPLENYNPIDTFSKRMPGEFEPCAMVKMCYPNNMPLSAYKTICDDNDVLLLVNPDYQNKSRIMQARSDFVGADINVDNVTFIDMPIDDDYGYWVRDFSPFYVFNDKELSIVDFTYNRPRYEQNAVPNKLATYFNMPYSKMDLTHTGGNLMQDGRGTAFSDDLVIQENNNSETKVLTQMSKYTGTDNYVITIDPQGDYIAHIDCWGKIVAPDKIIVAKLPRTNARYQYYEQVAEELANTKCAYGYNYRVYRIEEPGGTAIAPYTNSLIANNHVYMPLGNKSAYNEKALNVYREALPGYDIVGVKGFATTHECAFLNTDALHCRTHEVPDQNMLFIDSRDVYHGEVSLQDNYIIKANVVSYAEQDIANVTIHYSINNSEYFTSEMNKYQETTNYTYVFKGLKSGDDVKYYIDAKDNGNNYNIDPTCGQADPHHFFIA